MKKLLFIIIVSSLSITISACNKQVENRGYIIKFSDFSKIRPGVTTKQEVLQQYGSPTSTSLFGQETWYYIGKEQTKETIFNPKVKNYTGYEIKFDQSGKVASVDMKDKNSLKEVDIADDYTKTSGNEITIWQQLFGNLGKFNPVAGRNKGMSPSGTNLPGR